MQLHHNVDDETVLVRGGVDLLVDIEEDVEDNVDVITGGHNIYISTVSCVLDIANISILCLHLFDYLCLFLLLHRFCV